MQLDDHPYRTAPMNVDTEPSSEVDHEQAILYGLIAAVGALRVVVALALGGPFGTEPTIGAALVAFAAVNYAAERRWIRPGIRRWLRLWARTSMSSR